MDAITLYRRYALLLLGITVAVGTYLRAAMAWPQVRVPLASAHVVHAHSHGGFFGWIVLGAAAVILSRLPHHHATSLRHRSLAHLIGAGAILAFVAFALRGYDVVTITISAMHVALWFALGIPLRRALRDHAPDAAWSVVMRAALMMLLIAGASTVAPVLTTVLLSPDPWVVQLSVKLFLTAFLTGFVTLFALGVVRGSAEAGIEGPQVPGRAAAVVTDRLHRLARAPQAGMRLVMIGTLPSALLWVPGTPPLGWLPLLGRTGSLLVGIGILLLALPQAGARLAPALRLASLSAAVIGTLHVIAGFGAGATLLHSRPLVIAFVHLSLLGLATPALLHGVRARITVRSTVAYSVGLAVMLLPLVTLGWPAALIRATLAGVRAEALLVTAFAGGAAAALLLASIAIRSTARYMP